MACMVIAVLDLLVLGLVVVLVSQVAVVLATLSIYIHFVLDDCFESVVFSSFSIKISALCLLFTQ